MQKNPSCSNLRVGGQAVMEGVMMKGQSIYTVSVRKPDGTIITRDFSEESRFTKKPWTSIPVLRGIVRFIESLVVGMSTITYSSEFILEDEPKAAVKEPKTAVGRWFREHEDQIALSSSVVLGVILALTLFVLLPTLLSNLLLPVISSSLLLNLIEGLIRVAIFVLYLFAVSRMKEIARVFEYHGAEHKTINALENGEILTPENVLAYSRLNRRCGTSFLFLVMIISILVFAFIRVRTPLLRVLLRLLLIPVVAGLSYEVLMFSNKHESVFVRLLAAPGMALQKMTTREPDAQEVETAIASTLAVLAAEGRLPEHLKQTWEQVRETITYEPLQ